MGDEPGLPQPFTWRGDHVHARLPGGEVLFTTRRGGVSVGTYTSLNLGPWTDDDPASVKRNRARVAAEVGRPLAGVRQVHERAVHEVFGPPPRAEERDAAAKADALITRSADVAVGVLVADCLPIVLVAPTGVAAVHAGWRGLAAGVVQRAVEALIAGAGGPETVHAAIGPGARGCCYEVGDDVRNAFAVHGDAVRDERRVDLPAIARAHPRPPRGRARPRQRAVHALRSSRTAVLAPSRRRRHRSADGHRVADLIRGLDPERLATNAREVQQEIASACAVAGRAPEEVELVAAVKYVAQEELSVLAAAGIRVLGENRAQELERKAAAWREEGLGPVTWDFIGHLQSRKVKVLAPLVRRIHSVGSESALRELGKLESPPRGPGRGQRRPRGRQERDPASGASRRSSTRCPVAGTAG